MTFLWGKGIIVLWGDQKYFFKGSFRSAILFVVYWKSQVQQLFSPETNFYLQLILGQFLDTTGNCRWTHGLVAHFVSVPG